MVDVPFPVVSNFKKLIPRQYLEKMAGLLRSLGALGLHLKPNRVHVSEGEITLEDESKTETYTLETDPTIKKTEISTFKNIR